MKQHPQSILLAAICLGLTACATHRPVIDEAPITPPAPAPKAIGKVISVRKDVGFVVIKSAETPAVGAALQARSTDGQETAILKVSSEQKPPLVIADIMKGKPQVGDVVTK